MQTPLMLTALFCCFAISTPTHAKKRTEENRIQIQLFNNPCYLEGALKQETLRRIHAISPAQLPLIDSAGSAQKTLALIKANQQIPQGLQHYLSSQESRVQSLGKFYDGSNEIKKQNKSDQLSQLIKSKISQTRAKEDYKNAMALITQMLQARKSKDSFKALQEELFDIYQKHIVADPEEDFHLALQSKSVRVKYNCNFETKGSD